MTEDVDVLHVGPLQQRHQGAAPHQAPHVGPELALLLVGEPGPPGDQSRSVVLADDSLGDVHELPVDDIGRQLLALQLQELAQQPVVRPLE